MKLYTNYAHCVCNQPYLSLKFMIWFSKYYTCVWLHFLQAVYFQGFQDRLVL